MRIMTPTEEKNILSSLNFNVEEYIKKNGLVTEKNQAIELLCETSRAWALLDESLKSDSEIIMYYQPIGYQEITLRTPDLGDLIDYGSKWDGSIYKYEPGFEYKTYEELIKLGYLKPKTGCYDEFLIPRIEFPDDFDFETYIRIQDALKERPYEEDNSHLSRRMSAYVSICFSAIRTIGRGWGSGGTTTIYDRNLLKAIVPAMYKASTKTIGVYPGTEA